MHQCFLSARNAALLAVLLALLAALAWLLILLNLLSPPATQSRPYVHVAPIFMPQ
jgi:uncharacterized protein YhhL (DUF1145 family)